MEAPQWTPEDADLLETLLAARNEDYQSLCENIANAGNVDVVEWLRNAAGQSYLAPYLTPVPIAADHMKEFEDLWNSLLQARLAYFPQDDSGFRAAEESAPEEADYNSWEYYAYTSQNMPAQAPPIQEVSAEESVRASRKQQAPHDTEVERPSKKSKPQDPKEKARDDFNCEILALIKSANRSITSVASETGVNVYGFSKSIRGEGGLLSFTATDKVINFLTRDAIKRGRLRELWQKADGNAANANWTDD